MSEDQLTETDDEKLIAPVPLTPREKLFVRAFSDMESETFGRAVASATLAGYASPRDSAWRLRRRPRIVAAIAELEKLVRVQVGKVLTDLEFTRLAALTKGDLAVAARCSELQGKHIGMFYERNVLTLTDPGTYDPVRAAEARRITAFLLMNPVDPDLLPEVPQLPVVVEAVPVPQPARASAADFDALKSKLQAPRTRQESESAK